MGIIRFLLALSVLLSHLEIPGDFSILDNGSDAVQLFFIISGFYMFLTYEIKYKTLSRNTTFYFYTNRLLRIYPIYFIILAASIIYALYSSKFSPHLPNQYAVYIAFKGQLNNFWLYGLGMNNFSLLGMETLAFFKICDTSLVFRWHPDTDLSRDVLSQFQFVPQAWSLGMEFWFYMLCPFLAKLKTNKILLLFTGLLMIKIFFLYYVSNDYQWQYRFLPFELILFLLGAYVYRLYSQRTISIRKNRKLIFVLILFAILFLNTFSNYLLPKWLFYLAFAFCIPMTFELFKNNKIDKFLGDLSFPFFISHVLVILISREFVFQHEWMRIFFILTMVLLISIILVVITRPIERYRTSRLINE